MKALRESFISSRPIGPLDLLKHAVFPLVSSPQSRIVLLSSRRQSYQVAMASGNLSLDPLSGHDFVYTVNRAAQRTALEKIECGIAEDSEGWEYNIACRIDFGINIRDTAPALERAVRNFETEWESFLGLVEARLRSLVRLIVNQDGIMHSILDASKCRDGLERASRESDMIFEVLHVYHASFGDTEWKSHRARLLRVEEVEAKARFQKTMNNLGREEGVMRAAQSVVDLQREYALRADNFRRLLDLAEAEHKIEKVRQAFEKLGPEAAIAVVDPIAYGLMTSHRERMGEEMRQVLAKHNSDLVEILRKRLF